MLKRHKDLLRTIVGGLRLTLAGAGAADGSGQRGDLDRELERLGVAPDGALTPLDAVPNATAQERRARAAAEEFLGAAVTKAGAKKASEGAAAEARRLAREELVERAAYSWINRLLALRAMEARGLIDETLRSNPDYDGLSEALFVLRQSEPARTSGADGGWWAVIVDACTAQAGALPGLFDLADPAVALRPSTPALIRCIQIIGAAPAGFSLDEADAAFADPDAVGWAYQFYQEAAKARVYAKLGAGGKAATRSEIAAATQLFTEPYMVQWLLQNSLGRSYHEAYPDSKLPQTWDYYIRNRPEGQEPPAHPRPLEALDLIDPCCGSGHFLREAFDMFAAMYREQHPELSAAEIADRVLARHLHGIDLDPRAAQLAALTLYLRAWELVREEARQQRRPLSAIGYRLSAINIASTPSGLSAGALQRHLRRHPEDRVLRPLLEGVFAALEQADILGSLLRPAEHIDTAIKALQGTHQVAMDFEADDAALRRTITELARRDPAELKKVLLDRVAKSFAAEAGAGDVAADLFGREAERGVRLLQLLDRKYAVVVTNPPYMGARNLDQMVKGYIERYFAEGKRDLYSAFMIRCLELCYPEGRSAMITMHGWMFLRSFTQLRKSEVLENNRGMFAGILQSTSIEGLVHLGRHAFSEADPPSNAVMFALRNAKPSDRFCIWAHRMIASKPADQQASSLYYNLKSPQASNSIYQPRQSVFLSIPETPLVYWIEEIFLQMLQKDLRLGQVASIRQGMKTGDNSRFLRFFWENHNILFDKTKSGAARWRWYAKGGRYQKWSGLDWLVVDWEHDGYRLKSWASSGGSHWSRNITNTEYYFHPGLTYSLTARGSMNARPFDNAAFDVQGTAIFVKTKDTEWLPGVAAFLSSRLTSFLLRTTSQSLVLHAGYIANIPLANRPFSDFSRIGQLCVALKNFLIGQEPTEGKFSPLSSIKLAEISAVLHLLEGFNEYRVFEAHGVIGNNLQSVLEETGTPAGFHPLVAGYDALPVLPADLDLPPLPQQVLDYLAAHDRIAPSPAELRRIKERLRGLYEAGPGAKEDDAGEAEAAGGEDEEGEGAASGAHIPIPTETFLEELSVKMQLHPISVYWLLEELRREGARCKPEERRLLEDRLSVLVLRLLGHRWPKQIEAGEPVPAWADRDGIIALAPGANGLAERIRGRLRAEDGDVGANRAEGLLTELTGLSLEEWLRREFFKRHVRQFKYRPIAWHLASDPAAAAGGGKGTRRGGKRQPAFECLLYYHATAGDALARVRTQYVEPLLRIERQNLEAARRTRDETQAAQAQARIQELEEFTRRLREVEEQGFASPELDKVLANEPLDRWSGDGLLAPAEGVDLLRQERAWRVDLNDGVRVNIAPLQLAGLLVSDVLKAADAKKAIADRARWRSDERRWVREGKLPRCGWMPDTVPESEAWTKLAPQREAERRKLEEKRKAALGATENTPP